ncbi:MAG: lytic murein transglycosylase [bacterium]
MWKKENIKRHIILYSVILSITLLSTIRWSYSSLSEEEIKAKYKFFQPVIDKLIAENIDSSFVYALLSDPNTKFNEKYVKINVTGYLKKPDYSGFYNDNSLNKSLEFLNKNLDKLKDCEDKYNVPKEVITAIIWVETKHGDYLGNNHIPSVYLSTALASQEEYIDLNKKTLREDFTGTDSELVELDKKIEKRAVKKAKWALNELKSLHKIHSKGQIDILALRGSWAGAFGLSQFLPSSYLRCAVDGNGDNIIDLFTVDDAIHSVANYLKLAGWKSNLKSQEKAVHSYNNSNEYVNAVLKLSKKIKSAEKSNSE